MYGDGSHLNISLKTHAINKTAVGREGGRAHILAASRINNSHLTTRLTLTLTPVERSLSCFVKYMYARSKYPPTTLLGNMNFDKIFDLTASCLLYVFLYNT